MIKSTSLYLLKLKKQTNKCSFTIYYNELKSLFIPKLFCVKVLITVTQLKVQTFQLVDIVYKVGLLNSVDILLLLLFIRLEFI